ncbi:MAG: hypothetical protein QOF12_25 [Solirubrobacteraceae bacterium]|nr:hypothetical protein [Solirubrobacteraceae bacterium]
MACVMTQVSRPMLMALAATLLLAASWFTVLRPKPAQTSASIPTPAASSSASSGPTAPGVRGLTRAIKDAKSVAAGKPTPNPLPSATTGPPAATKAAPAPATAAPAAVKATPVAPAAVVKHKAPKHQTAKHPAPALTRLTLLLFAGSGADDAVARSVVRSLRGPRVRTIVAPIGAVAHYRSLIGDLQITDSPTILVIGGDHQARQIIGLPDRRQVQQALAAAQRK